MVQNMMVVRVFGHGESNKNDFGFYFLISTRSFLKSFIFRMQPFLLNFANLKA